MTASKDSKESTCISRGESSTAATSKMEHFVITVNDWKSLNIITKRSIFDVAAVLDPPLIRAFSLAKFKA